MDQFECDVVFLTLIRLQDEYGSRFRRSPLQIRTAMKRCMEFVATNGVVTALDHVQEFMGTNSTMQFLQSTTGSQQTIAGYHHQTDTKRTEAFDDVGLLARMQQSHSAASILLLLHATVCRPPWAITGTVEHHSQCRCIIPFDSGMAWLEEARGGQSPDSRQQWQQWEGNNGRWQR